MLDMDGDDEAMQSSGASALIDMRKPRYLQSQLATSSNVPILPTLSFVSVFTCEPGSRAPIHNV